MQKYIVPWSIAIHGLSFAKRMTIDSVKEMLIAIIDEKELMPGHPNCAKEVARYLLAFEDFAKKVKAAAVKAAAERAQADAALAEKLKVAAPVEKSDAKAAAKPAAKSAAKPAAKSTTKPAAKKSAAKKPADAE